jgi:hypothetical protein
MRRPTRPFTVEFKSRRKPAQGSVLDDSRGRLIDEPAPDEVPSRDVSEDAPASAGDDTPFAAANRVFSKFTSGAVSTAASLSDLASSAFASQPTEPSEPSPAAAPDEPPQGEGIPPSPVPAGASQDARPEDRDVLSTEPAPKRRRTPTGSLAHAEHASDRDEQAAESARPAMMLEKQVSVAAPSAPAQKGHSVPDGPKPTRRRAEARVPVGEGWKRRRLPKACW